eukprot:gene39852-13043_t
MVAVKCIPLYKGQQQTEAKRKSEPDFFGMPSMYDDTLGSDWDSPRSTSVRVVATNVDEPSPAAALTVDGAGKGGAGAPGHREGWAGSPRAAAEKGNGDPCPAEQSPAPQALSPSPR